VDREILLGYAFEFKNSSKPKLGFGNVFQNNF